MHELRKWKNANRYWAYRERMTRIPQLKKTIQDTDSD